MCRLILTAGLCLTIAVLASAVPLDQFCAVKKNGDYTNPNDRNSYISCSNGLTYISCTSVVFGGLFRPPAVSSLLLRLKDRHQASIRKKAAAQTEADEGAAS
ncbi:hypothetical protein Q5P01_009417 [Channa striata]|uniref:Uncharacterized protein n=1 Tax=Channa striata TaxID=64152 RepID=A0AA88N5V1_CHASR|nr:hypothetical protein Q5P01_009417 [Channa striata]